MKFGANTFIWTEAFGPEHFEILPRLKAAGFDGIEIAMLAPASVPAAAIRRELEKYDFECTCCSAFGPGLSLAAQTFMLDGRQYLIAATGDTLWSFVLY
jgi:sugar phosphate isomerase/epimerase